MNISVVITTYNSPDWLERVVWGFYAQTHKQFELVIADDGSGEDTRTRIEFLKNETGLDIQHVWHEDDGFQKTVILNKAIKASKYEYILFTDGDCVPRADYLAVHAAQAEPGYFLSGGYFMLPMETSKAIRNEDIITQNAFQKDWLISNGLSNSHKTMKLTARGLKAKLLNKFTPTKATWNGHNASIHKDELVAVNGFDERMQYGGLDRELGERLFNKGIKSKQIRYSAICIHLDHARGYKTKETLEKNAAIRSETRSSKKTWTEFGIEKTHRSA